MERKAPVGRAVGRTLLKVQKREQWRRAVVHVVQRAAGGPLGGQCYHSYSLKSSSTPSPFFPVTLVCTIVVATSTKWCSINFYCRHILKRLSSTSNYHALMWQQYIHIMPEIIMKFYYSFCSQNRVHVQCFVIASPLPNTTFCGNI